MKIPSLEAILSFVVNILLSATLVWVIYTNADLRAYASQTISGNYDSLVLAFGIGGGSAAGYVLLRRRQSGSGLGGRLRAKPMKQVAPLSRPNGTSLQNRNVPVGAPPGPVSKHTAYAVPPLSKASPQIVQRPAPSASWSAAPKQWSPSTFQAQQAQQQDQRITGSMFPTQAYSQPSHQTGESDTDQQGPQPFSQPIRREPPGQQRTEPTPAHPTFPSLRQDLKQPPIPLRPGETAGRTELAPQWRPESSRQPMESETGSVPYSKPFQENTSRPPTAFGGQPQVQGEDKTFQPRQWTSPIARSEYPTPQKWAPPTVSPVPITRPQTLSTSPPRPGQGSQNRPPFPGQQGPPRPLTFPGSLRPPPIGVVPGMFRHDQPRPPGTGTPRPPLTNPGTMPAGPNPQIEQGKGSLVQQSTTPRTREGSQTQPQAQPTETTSSNPSIEAPAGEMDWDTALDAILKTLRKDKVEDKA